MSPVSNKISFHFALLIICLSVVVKLFAHCSRCTFDCLSICPRSIFSSLIKCQLFAPSNIERNCIFCPCLCLWSKSKFYNIKCTGLCTTILFSVVWDLSIFLQLLFVISQQCWSVLHTIANWFNNKVHTQRRTCNPIGKMPAFKATQSANTKTNRFVSQMRKYEQVNKGCQWWHLCDKPLTFSLSVDRNARIGLLENTENTQHNT